MLAFIFACAPGTPIIDATDDTAAPPADNPPELLPPGDTNDPGDTTAAPAWAGNGADGPLEVTADTEASQIGATLFRITAVDGDTVTVDHDVTGLAVGDEALFLVTQGTRDRYEDAGAYVFATVTGVDGATVTLSQAPPIGPLDAQSAILQRVPHFTDVTVSAALSPPAYDGVAGGVLAFRATGVVRVAAGGRIHADGKGYAGGATGDAYDADGHQGTSYTGIGLGGGMGGSYNSANGAWENNGGGGGACVSGAGGEHAGGATDGMRWYSGAETPTAGEPYGDATLSRLYFGSGGGGVWNGDGEPGAGGNGGGIVFIAARTIAAEAPAALSVRGGDTEAWASGNWTYGAGGGAGGSIWLIADTLDLAQGAAVATGGAGVTDVERPGGDGGDGRIRFDVNQMAGANTNAAADPDPGYTDTP